MILARRTILAAAVEAVEGTAESLQSTNCLRVSNVGFNPTVEMNRRPVVRDSLSRIPDLPGVRSAQLSFDVELVGNSVGGDAPDWGVLMKGCGFIETPGASSNSYSLSSTPADFKSLTLGVYNDGVVSKLWGARGTVQSILEAGKPGILRFTFTGADFDVNDGSMPSPSFDTSIPAPFKEAVFSLAGQALKIGGLTLSLNNTVELRPDITKPGGHLSAMIVGRDASGEFDPEMELVATHDFYGLWKSGQTSALAAQWGSGTRQVSIVGLKCQYSGIRWRDRGALRSLGVTFSLCEDSGSDELEITLGEEA